MDKISTIHTPWLSIVIPVYNAEKTLPKCMASILGQTDQFFEIILVNDGSTDSSGAICKKYSQEDPRVQYFQKDNGGAYQTRIYGAERARGTYITFCDADDYYITKDAFAILRAELGPGSYDALQFGFVKKYPLFTVKKPLVTRDIVVGQKQFISCEYPKLLCSFWEDAHLTTSLWNKAYHRSLLSWLPDSSTAERIFWGEDQILNLHLLEHCTSFRFIPDLLYGYRQGSGGTAGFSLRTMQDMDKIKRYQLAFLERYQRQSREKIKEILFTEVAGWFFNYIKQAVISLPQEEVKTLILETLALPRVQQAREYFLEHPQNTWIAVELLRRADVQAYIHEAIQSNHNAPGKEKLRNWVRNVFI